MVRARPQAVELLRILLVSADAEALAVFYERALGFRRKAATRYDGADAERMMGMDGVALGIVLALGRQQIELLQFERGGRAYPQDASSSDLAFQHVAVVVGAMDAAYAHLRGADGWTSISEDGPQVLPASSGGVTAFKFRDPEGHPLELLAFPDGKRPPYWQQASAAGPFLGLDHSAISVSDTAASIAFYRSLGLSVSGGSLNTGAEQGRLDDLADPHVDVTALAASQPTPHLELLAYRRERSAATATVADHDIAATRLLWRTQPIAGLGKAALPVALTDPDGHRHLLVPG